MKYLGNISDPKDLVTKEYVDSSLNGYVDKTSAQSVGGVKTFTDAPYRSTLYDGRYQEVAYIQGNGVPYINTGKPVHMGWRYRIDFQQSDSGSYRIWGAFNQQAYNGGLNTSLTYSVGWTFRWETTNGQTREASLNTPLDANRHVAEMINGKAYMDGVYKNTSAAHNSTVVSNYNAFLFTINPGGTTPTTTMKGKVYSYRVWNSDGALVQDLVPAYDTTDSVAGMYDRCDGSFHRNANTSGAFTYGSDVSDSMITSENSLAKVALSGLYSDLDGRPSFSAVATSGSYSDLSNKPTLLTLGETSSTAYRGDRGKTAYNHSQVTSGNPHNVSKSDVGLGNVDNVQQYSASNPPPFQSPIYEAIYSIDEQTDEFVCDKTYNELLTAYNAGKVLIANYEGIQFSLSYYNESDGFVFSTTVTDPSGSGDGYSIFHTSESIEYAEGQLGMTLDEIPVQNSMNGVTSGGVYNAIAAIPVGTVVQTNDTSNNDYRILLSYLASNAETTAGVKKNDTLLFNPYTGILQGHQIELRRKNNTDSALRFHYNDANYAEIKLGYVTDISGNITSYYLNFNKNGSDNIQLVGLANPIYTNSAATKGYVDNAIPAAYTSNPAMDGTASAGSSPNYAKGDHVHPTDTSRLAANLKGAINGVAELDANGKVPITQIPDASKLPTVSSSDNGKILMVVDGVWTAVNLPLYDGGVS